MKPNKLLFKILFSLLTLCLTIYSQWFGLNTGTTQNLNAIYFIDAETGFACGAAGTIIKTTNGGTNWSVLISGSSAEIRSIHFFNSTTGILCGYTGTILRTTDGGANWNVINSGTTTQLLGISFIDNLSGICVGNSGTTLYSTNSGMNWLVGQPTGYLVTFYTAFMVNASTGYCAGVNTIFSPLFAKTTNGGANWTYSAFYVNNNEATLRDIHFMDANNGIAVSNLWNGQGGISKTTNAGVNWSHQVFASAFYGVDFAGILTGYIVGFSGSILKTIDGGNNWVQQTSGTGAFLKSVEFIDSLVGYAAGDGGVILKTTNGGVTGFKQVSGAIPLDFKLYQNYPNPFNPTTKIKFDLPKSNLTLSEAKGLIVTLIIYDILGREIQTLVNEQLKPGTYEVDFDGSNLPSGVYYYMLTAGDPSLRSGQGFSETKKMILIK